jgi:hypothetical protein
MRCSHIAVPATLAALLVGLNPTSSLLAGGSVPADEVIRLTRQAPKLGAEIQQRLGTQKMGDDTITCTSTRVGRTTDPRLGGARVGPYNCSVGQSQVEITVHKTPAAARAAKKGDTDTQGMLTWKWR